MKRTTPDHVASNRSGNNLPPQTNEGDEVRAQNEGGWYNPKMKEKGGKVFAILAYRFLFYLVV